MTIGKSPEVMFDQGILDGKHFFFRNLRGPIEVEFQMVLVLDEAILYMRA